MGRLTGRGALVTGGASGIGKAIAKRLRDEGANVMITDVQPDLGRSTAGELGLEFILQDVSEESRWSEVMHEFQRSLGRLHVLVNNAGIAGPLSNASPEVTSLSDWRQIFGVNVEGVFLGCRAAIGVMKEGGGGSIINISSVAALLATPYATAYGASKACVRQLTKSVAQYCAQNRLAIRCNSVHPVAVRTPLWEGYAQTVADGRNTSVDTVVADAVREIPLGDFTTAEDIASAVAFLASDDSRHVTGIELVVDGGLLNCNTYRAARAPETSR
jgi:3(or 17)beta-hydroxysteroid dehydrogenase